MTDRTTDSDSLSSHTDEPQHQSPLAERLAVMKEKIFSRRPILGELMRSSGATDVHHYTKRFSHVATSPTLTSRKWECTTTVHQLIEERFDTAVADSVSEQLLNLPLVSTIDHHGPIDHPFFVNTNLISAIPFIEDYRRGVDNLIVFSFASVSVNNASAYPRGILFHGGENGEGEMIRLPILPDKVKMGVVYGMRPMTREELDRALQSLEKKAIHNEVAPERAEKIRVILENIFGAPDVLAAKDFASQISIINHRLWPRLLNAGRHPSKPYDRVPHLIYLEIETLVTELLLQHHLTQADSPLYRLLFDPAYHQSALTHFNNIPGAFSTEGDWGTFMFWALDEKLRRVRLRLVENTLVSPDGAYRFALTPESISQALRDKKIFPSMILCYLMISLYYGMKCLGGFSQIHDLTLTKKAWQALLRAHGNEAEAIAIEPVETSAFGGDGMVLAYVKNREQEWQPATGIDMAIANEPYLLKNYLDLAKHVKVSTIMEPMMPEIYEVLYSQDQRDPALADITPAEIIRANGLAQNISNVYEPRPNRNLFIHLPRAATRRLIGLAKRVYGAVR